MVKAACYARVSTKNQDLDRQIEKLEDYCNYKDWDYNIYSEKRSSVKDRPKLEKIFNNLNSFDCLVVTKLDRFARSTKDMISRIDTLDSEDVELVIIEQNIDTSTMEGDLMLKILMAFAEFERKMIRERLSEGYREALEEGRVGRNKKISGEVESDFREWWEKYGGSPSVIRALLDSRHGVQVSNKTVYNTADRLGLREKGDD